MSILANYVVEFPLVVERYQADILDKRFEIARKMENGLINKTQKMYKEMIKTKRYRELFASLTGDKKKDKPIWEEINAIRKANGFSEYGFHKLIKDTQHHFKKNIDSFTAQKIASHVWASYHALFFKNGKEVRFKKYGQVNSVEGKNNKTGIVFNNDKITWLGLSLPVVINYGNLYEYQAIQSRICYNRIVRKWIKNKYKYYVQIVLEGTPPIKYDKNTGEIKHSLGQGDVGIDIGISTLAVCSEDAVMFDQLAEKAQGTNNKRRLLQRKLDRSRRATNLECYNADGTVKERPRRWKKSKHYLRLEGQVRELYRKEKAIRKYSHECDTNKLLPLGDKFYVEEMNFAGLQKRAKQDKTVTGKNKRRKRFGKSIANRAPAMFLSILDRKLRYFGAELMKIDTVSAKASQFNHIDGTYNKKTLSERWNYINDIPVQRDMYSSFLIRCIDQERTGFDIEKCNLRFKSFVELHNAEVERLRCKKNLSCMGI